jgi:hypothetical protein
MPTVNSIRLLARDASVYLKIGAAIVGFVAAVLWYWSATAPDPAVSVTYNKWAAAVTGGAVFLQAVSSLIDWWISPTASWG